MNKVNPNNERRVHSTEQHPLCNGMLHNIREDGTCVQCDSMFENYPLNIGKSLEEVILEKYPDVIFRR